MGLFSSDTDDGCTAHHWGDYTIDWRRSTVEKKFKMVDGEQIELIKFETEKTARCQHDGCHTVDFKMGPRFYVPTSTMSSSKRHVKLMSDMGEFVSGEDGTEAGFALLSRAMRIHANRDDDNEGIAEALKELGNSILDYQRETYDKTV